jgi:DNA primase
MFNIFKFLNDFNIPIPDANRNTGVGWVNIQCPFCDDDKNHLGFNYEDNYFHCWKCEEGYHPIKEVVTKLLPYENVNEILKRYDTIEQISFKLHKKLNKTKKSSLVLPGEPLKMVHKKYLKNRDFDPEYLEQKYKLKGSLHVGQYRYRIIIPIYFNQELVTFQTRTINNSKPRYVNCDPDKEIIPIKNILYNYDNCNENFCVLTEGVFKVFRLGKNSLASLGKNYTKQQLRLLTKFKVVFIYFDPDIYGQEKAKKISAELDSIGIEVHNVLNDKAPDDLSKKESVLFWKEIKKLL